MFFIEREVIASRRNEVTMWINLPSCSLFAGNLRLVNEYKNFARLLCINSKNLRHELLAEMSAKLASKRNDKLSCSFMSCVLLHCLKRASDNRFGNKTEKSTRVIFL